MARVTASGEREPTVPVTPPPRRAKRLTFGRYETKKSKQSWDIRSEILKYKQMADSMQATVKRKQEQESARKLVPANLELERLERQRRALERRAEREAFADSRERIKIEQAEEPRNPYMDLFPEVEERAMVQNALKPLLPQTRAAFTVAIDPNSGIDLSTFPGKTRGVIERARNRDLNAVLELAGTPEHLNSITDAARTYHSRHLSEVNRLKRMAINPAGRFDTEKRVRYEAEDEEDMLKARQSIARVDKELMKKYEAAKAVKTLHATEAELQPELTPEEKAQSENNWKLAMTNRYSDLINYTLETRYPGIPSNEVDVSFDDENGQIVFRHGSNPPIGVNMPPLWVGQLHGKAVESEFSKIGVAALPSDSPYFKYRDKPTVWQVLARTAEVTGGVGIGIPYGAFKLLDAEYKTAKKVYGPLIPDFDLGDVSLREAAPFTMPQLALAELASKALQAIAGVRLPRPSDLTDRAIDIGLKGYSFAVDTDPFRNAAKLAGIEKLYPRQDRVLAAIIDAKIPITDDIPTELASMLLVPSSLAPGIGFYDDIIRIGGRIGVKIAEKRFASFAAKEGLESAVRKFFGKKADELLAKLGTDSRFLKRWEDWKAVLKSEAGHIFFGGERAGKQAEKEVLLDIINGVETTDPKLIPVREAMENLLDEQEASAAATELLRLTRELDDDAIRKLNILRTEVAEGRISEETAQAISRSMADDMGISSRQLTDAGLNRLSEALKDLPDNYVIPIRDDTLRRLVDDTGFTLIEPEAVGKGNVLYIDQKGKGIGTDSAAEFPFDEDPSGYVAAHDMISDAIMDNAEANLNDHGFIRVRELANEFDLQISYMDDVTSEAAIAIRKRAEKYDPSTPVYIDVNPFRSANNTGFKTTAGELQKGNLRNLLERNGLLTRDEELDALAAADALTQAAKSTPKSSEPLSGPITRGLQDNDQEIWKAAERTGNLPKYDTEKVVTFWHDESSMAFKSFLNPHETPEEFVRESARFAQDHWEVGFDWRNGDIQELREGLENLRQNAGRKLLEDAQKWMDDPEAWVEKIDDDMIGVIADSLTDEPLEEVADARRIVKSWLKDNLPEKEKALSAVDEAESIIKGAKPAGRAAAPNMIEDSTSGLKVPEGFEYSLNQAEKVTGGSVYHVWDGRVGEMNVTLSYIHTPGEAPRFALDVKNPFVKWGGEGVKEGTTRAQISGLGDFTQLLEIAKSLQLDNGGVQVGASVFNPKFARIMKRAGFEVTKPADTTAYHAVFDLPTIDRLLARGVKAPEEGARMQAARRLLADTEKWLDDDMAQRLGREGGGGRLIGLKQGDQVKILGGDRFGETGRIVRVMKKGRTYEIELPDGQKVIRDNLQLGFVKEAPTFKETEALGKDELVAALQDLADAAEEAGVTGGILKQAQKTLKNSGEATTKELRARIAALVNKSEKSNVPAEATQKARQALRTFNKVPGIEEAPMSRLDRIADLERRLPYVKKGEASAIKRELKALKRQEKLVEGFKEQTVAGKALDTQEKRHDMLRELKRRWNKAKKGNSKNALMARIRALEEVMGLREGIIRPEAVNVIEEARTAYLASQSEVIHKAQFRTRQVEGLLKKFNDGEITLTPEDIQRLKGEYDESLAELARIRQEADEGAESLATAAAEVAEGRVSPLTKTLADYEKFAFARISGAGRVMRKVGSLFQLPKYPKLNANMRLKVEFRWWRPFKLYDPSLFSAENPIARKFLALGRLIDALNAATATAENALLARGVPFNISKEGIESQTGVAVWDLIEHWDTYAHLFDENTNDFVALLEKTRREALEDMRVLGIDIPSDWDGARHVFRRALKKDNIPFADLEFARKYPDSLLARSFTAAADAIEEGVEYNQDIISAHIDSLRLLRTYAAEKSFFKEIQKRGVALRHYISQQKTRNLQVAGREHALSKLVYDYVQESSKRGGRPAAPRLTYSNPLQHHVPDDLQGIAARVESLNLLKDSNDRSKQMMAIRKRMSNIHRSYQARLKTAKGQWEAARRSVKGPQDPDPFKWVPGGLQGAKVEKGKVLVSPAPMHDFPDLAGRVYLQSDMDELIKLAGRADNAFTAVARAAATISGVIKTSQTSLDPGFWFIQGLGALGLDMWRMGVNTLKLKPHKLITGNPLFAPILAPFGKSDSIWGKSMWRSIVGLTNPKKAEEYWAREIAEHIDAWGEFVYHARVFTGHSGVSNELVREMSKGGVIEKLESVVPGFAQIRPIGRAGNAFGNFMNAASWETWKALRPLAKNDVDLEELGSFVRNISGRNPAHALGISKGQEAVERSLFYAREYTRASAAIMAKAFLDPTSFGGRQAVKSLSGLGMAMTFIFGGISVVDQLNANGGNFNKLDWDDLGKDIIDSWNPFGRHFFARRIGKGVYGFGGAYRSNIALLAKLVKAGYFDYQRLGGPAFAGKEVNEFSSSLSNPIDFDQPLLINWRHPVVQGLRSKSAPLIGTSIDIITGRDYLGYAVDDPKEFLSKDLPTSLAPFAVQSLLKDTGQGWYNRIGTATAEWFGLRGYPVDARQLYIEEAERATGAKWVDIDGTPLLQKYENDEENYPELVAARLRWDDEKRARNNEYQEVSDELEAHHKQLQEKESEAIQYVDWGQPGGAKAFSKVVRENGVAMSDNFNLLATQKGLNLDSEEIRREDFPNKDKYLARKIAELDPNEAPYLSADQQTIDWDRWKRDKQNLLSQMTPGSRKAYEEKKFDVDDPLLEKGLRARAQAAEDLQFYFEAPKYKDLPKEREHEVEEMLNLVDQVKAILTLSGHNVSRSRILKYMFAGGIGDSKIVSIALLDSISVFRPYVRSTERTDWIFTHPDVPVFYSFVFNQGLDKDEQEEWLKYYGHRKEPSMGETRVPAGYRAGGLDLRDLSGALDDSE